MNADQDFVVTFFVGGLRPAVDLGDKPYQLPVQALSVGKSSLTTPSQTISVLACQWCLRSMLHSLFVPNIRNQRLPNLT